MISFVVPVFHALRPQTTEWTPCSPQAPLPLRLLQTGRRTNALRLILFEIIDDPSDVLLDWGCRLFAWRIQLQRLRVSVREASAPVSIGAESGLIEGCKCSHTSFSTACMSPSPEVIAMTASCSGGRRRIVRMRRRRGKPRVGTSRIDSRTLRSNPKRNPQVRWISAWRSPPRPTPPGSVADLPIRPSEDKAGRTWQCPRSSA